MNFTEIISFHLKISIRYKGMAYTYLYVSVGFQKAGFNFGWGDAICAIGLGDAAP